jgi:alpha-glucuronidase
MASGRTLWEELLQRYQEGVDAVRKMQATWQSLAGAIDAERYDETRAFLKIQEQEARWWRDASVLYFQTFSKLPIPPGYEMPEHDLEYYKAINKKYVPGI